MKILVVHHVRSFEDTSIYLSDDFLQANSILYGAQELDTWGGIRLLARNHEVSRLEICPNQNQIRLIASTGTVQKLLEVKFNQGLRKYLDRGYLKALLKYLDTSISYFGSTQTRKSVATCLGTSKFDVIWWDTQFYDALIPKETPSVVRSVNFEPKHVLAEDSTKIKYIRMCGKYWSEFLISRKRVIVCISLGDLKSYTKLFAREIRLIPLRQLPFILTTDFEVIHCENTLIFFGSTFDVRHNRRNLEKIVYEIAPRLKANFPQISINSFGNRAPGNLEFPANMIHFGFQPNLQGRQLGCLGVIVPFHGGAGMQSKIFEPLSLGVPVIANPKNFAGFPLIPYQHYLPATSVAEYLRAVEHLVGHPEKARQMAANAKTFSIENFSFDYYFREIDSLLEHICK